MWLCMHHTRCSLHAFMPRAINEKSASLKDVKTTPCSLDSLLEPDPGACSTALADLMLMPCREGAAADHAHQRRVFPEPYQRVLLPGCDRRPEHVHSRGHQHALGSQSNLPLQARRAGCAQGDACIALHGHAEHLVSPIFLQALCSLLSPTGKSRKDLPLSSVHGRTASFG